jgi:hypothetical protein
MEVFISSNSFFLSFFLCPCIHIFLSSLFRNFPQLRTRFVLCHMDSLLGKDIKTDNETAAVAMQQHGKHASTVIELLSEMVLSAWSVHRSYLEDNWGNPVKLVVPWQSCHLKVSL